VTAADSGVVRETTLRTFDGQIKQINELFEDTGISDDDQINAVESIMRTPNPTSSYNVKRLQMDR
jgi:type I restriction enzyme R subunit